MLKRLLSLLIATMPLFAHAIEEPDFDVVQQLDGAEVRAYAPYVVAEVRGGRPGRRGRQPGLSDPGGLHLRQEQGRTKFDMTAPVTQSAEPVKLEMTAPVTQAAAPGGYRVQFVLPRGVTLATAPEPLDPRVQLREVAGQRVAVIRYSGFWSQSN